MINSCKNKSYGIYLSTLSILLMASPWAYANFQVTNAPPAPFYTGTKAASTYPSEPLAKPLNIQTAVTKSPETAVKPKAQPANTSSAPDYSSYLGFQINVLAGVAGLSTGPREYSVPMGPSVSIPAQLSGHSDTVSFAPGLGIAYAFNMANHKYNPSSDAYLLQSIALGVNAYYLGGTNSASASFASGSFLPSTDVPIGNNKNTLSSLRIMLDSEFDFHPLWQRVLPFVQVGIGPAIDKMKYAHTQAPPGSVLIIPSFSTSATQTNFAYELGAGLKVDLAPHSQLSLRYLYSNMGDVSVSSPGNLASPYTVNMHASSLLLGYTYAFGA